MGSRPVSTSSQNWSWRGVKYSCVRGCVWVIRGDWKALDIMSEISSNSIDRRLIMFHFVVNLWQLIIVVRLEHLWVACSCSRWDERSLSAFALLYWRFGLFLLIFAFYARRLQLLPFQRHVYLSFDFSSFLHVIVRLVWNNAKGKIWNIAEGCRGPWL